jgi:hypothetical protein
MRFVVTHPPDPRPALIVETVATVDEATIAGLKKALFGRGCPNGLLFDANVCVILHDAYTSYDPSSFQEDGRVSTDRLLARVRGDRPLDERVFDWLRSMAASWNDTLPEENAVAAPFIMDIVPAVSGSSVRQIS